VRIATSTVYEQQIAAIDSLYAQESQYGQELSTGKSLNVPSDDPTQIAQDLSVRTDIGVQTQVGQNLNNTSQQLTSVDGAMSSLTSVLQSARSLAIQAASDTNTPSQLQEVATQVYQLLQESVGIANTQYGGQYLFAGTASPSSTPVTYNASSASVVNFSGNDVAQQQKLPNGQTLTTSATLQQVFNYGSADGSPSVFQVLQNLYTTLSNASTTNESSSAVNVSGQAVAATSTVTNMLGGASPQLLQTPLNLDSAGSISITISSQQSPNGTQITFLPTDTMANVIAKINAQTAATGVTASFDYTSQRLTLTSANQTAFEVADTPSPGATNAGNFVEAFNLSTQASTVSNLSTQLGDIDHVTQVLLTARAAVGSTIQQVQALNSISTSQANNDTTVQSNIEDTDVAKASSQLSLTQTALEAAYGTTTKIEQKDLFDYLG
jgi:flagellar hook-associated protein 3 FlgL